MLGGLTITQKTLDHARDASALITQKRKDPKLRILSFAIVKTVVCYFCSALCFLHSGQTP